MIVTLVLMVVSMTAALRAADVNPMRTLREQ
jgi:hypothetical protein